jgi:hypothetical protein
MIFWAPAGAAAVDAAARFFLIAKKTLLGVGLYWKIHNHKTHVVFFYWSLDAQGEWKRAHPSDTKYTKTALDLFFMALFMYRCMEVISSLCWCSGLIDKLSTSKTAALWMRLIFRRDVAALSFLHLFIMPCFVPGDA